MKPIVVILLLLGVIVPSTGWSQENEHLASFTAVAEYVKAHRIDSTEQARRLAEDYLRITQRKGSRELELKTLLLLTRFHFDERNFPEFDAYSQRALRLAEELNDQVAISDAYFYRANHFFNQTRIADGLPLMEEAYAYLPTEAQYHKRSILILAGLGYWNGQMGKLDVAFERLHAALDLAQADSMLTYQSYLLTLLSSTSIQKGDYRRALMYEQASLETSLRNQDEGRAAISRHNLSDIYLQLGDYVKALAEGKEIEKNLSLVDDPRMEAAFNERMGEIYLRMEQFPTSRKYFAKAIEQYAASNDRGAVAIATSKQAALFIATNELATAEASLEPIVAEMANLNDTVIGIQARTALAEVWAEQGKHELAQTAYYEALAFYGENDFWAQTAGTATKLARSLLAMNRSEEALSIAQIAFDNYVQANMKIGQSEVLELQYQIYKKQGDLAKALERHEVYFQYVDELKTEFAQQRLMEERVRQNINELESEKQSMVFQNETLTSQNRMFGLLALVLVVGISLISWLYWRLNRSKQALAEQKQHLEELNYTKDRFFSIIAHDLRNPIVALKGVGMQMEHFLEEQDPENLLEVAHLVGETSGHLNQLLDNLLAWALSQTGHFPYHPIRLSAKEIIQKTTNVFAATAKVKQIKVKVKTQEEVELFADQPAVNAIFRNLIANALKFTQPGGEIEISAQAQSNGEVVCAVKDNGKGIPADQVTQLFSLKNKSQHGTLGEKGTGLGLVLCKELVDLHQGNIYAESTEGEGTTIFFTLPQAA
ncbi:MAG: ATP-binding protein [Bacteroidota bacterium]